TRLPWGRPSLTSVDRLKGTTSVAKEARTLPHEDPRALTVSRRPEAGGRFRSIAEALDRGEPGMTIRVLDDGGYEERLLINRREQHREVVLEAVGGATIRGLPGVRETVWIRDVPGFTLRGFRFQYVPDGNWHCQILLTGLCPGATLDGLNVEAGH